MRDYYGDFPDYYAEMTKAFGDRGIWNVESLWVSEPLRNRGLARKMMALVTTDADAEQVELWLVLAPLEEEGTTRDRLKRFYQSLGFEEVGVYMIRKPQ